MTDKKILRRLDKLEQALFGGKVEDQFFEEGDTTQTLFGDTLERTIFMMLLELALEGKIGATSALLAEQTKKTKNTVNVRLERLYYKRLIQKQEIGNAMLYYVPLQELLLGAITKELVALRIAQGDLPAEASVEELEKTILAKYLTDVQVVFGRSQAYFVSLTTKTDYTQLNLKDELLQ
jgi:predicted transcriptional regulator